MQDRIFQLGEIEDEPIEREEQGNNTVIYRNMQVLAPGTWTDAASRETIWYSPDGIRNLEVEPDNVVNIAHDVENEVSEVGQMLPESAEATDEGLFVDLEIDTSTAAGEYADENLQTTLESGGAKGFGGPSVEIRSDETEFNQARGLEELKGGIVSGLGLVANPASKSVSFARQTAKKGVALSQTDKGVYRLNAGMQIAQLEETLADHGIDTDDKDGAELMQLADALGISLADDEEEEEDEEDRENQEDEEDEDMEEEESEDNPEDEDEEEDEEPDMSQEDMANAIQSLEERLQNVEDMLEQAAQEQQMSEEIEEATENLADAETVSELQEAKEELDKRLSELEDEPKKPRTLADGDGSEEDNDGPENVTPIETPTSRF